MGKYFEEDVGKLIETMREVELVKTNKYLVYLLFQDLKCVYVGQSKRGIARVYDHLPNKKFNRVTIVECSEGELNNTEAMMIAKYRPLLNRRIPPNDVILSKEKLKLHWGVGGVSVNQEIRRFDVRAIDGYQSPVYYWGDFHD